MALPELRTRSGDTLSIGRAADCSFRLGDWWNADSTHPASHPLILIPDITTYLPYSRSSSSS